MTLAAPLADDPAAALPAVTPSDPALIQYTSGSTGSPKGVCLTPAYLVSNCEALATTTRSALLLQACSHTSWIIGLLPINCSGLPGRRVDA